MPSLRKKVRSTSFEAIVTIDTDAYDEEKEVFSSQRPTDFEQCEARFWLANGGTLGELTKLREQDASIYRQMKDVGFPRTTPATSNEFMTQLSSWDRWEMIRDKKNDTGYRRQLDPTPMLSSVWGRLERDTEQERFIISDSGISGRIKKLVDDCFRENGNTPPRDLTVPQLLDGLLAVVQSEMPHMFFDFWTMNRFCDSLQVKYQCFARGLSSVEMRSMDLDKNLVVDLYFKVNHRKLVERWAQASEMKKTSTLAEDWRKWCE
ncbi:hypothetical protein CPLU01_09866 [Colletotrichum plurivorum]|uniref:Uncharacterized protein n=1 Tax=Colletotrichum plurivorum TaxID=2175906 RepID=A0A8H6K6U9_9PEZI|nr:hypothetical protein CPLU01_09866 [Colletotrichum plurivorum]